MDVRSGGVLIDGFYLESGTGTNCHGVAIDGPIQVELENVITQAEDDGIRADNNALVEGNGGAVSAWDSANGVYGANNAVLKLQYVVCVNNTYNAYADAAEISMGYGIVSSGTYGCYALGMGYIYVDNGTAMDNSNTGYYAGRRAYILATSTNANNSGNGADYSPAASDTFGNSNGSITWS